ncbi:DUF4132 domain-containing protein [Thorsellia anophelis]|uniref:DUF4132 domain-containing protein n=1 Tax=Thorsellia anophelis DSM 18579 TaxID=1123402 RepID=A0A1I0EH48_9GAMM|nr:DUF4132 domain-containing protein [Thorsellia anophelis]SET43918.1 protein of unknown function [Thorsellia anophelis DSM 18579]
MKEILLNLADKNAKPIKSYLELFIALGELEPSDYPEELAPLRDIPKPIFEIFVIILSTPLHYYAYDKKQSRYFITLQYKLYTLMQEKFWTDEDIEQVFSWLLGDKSITKHLLQAVDSIQKMPYQLNYERRSYRNPSNKFTVLQRQMLFLRSFLNHYWLEGRVQKNTEQEKITSVQRILFKPLDLIELITNQYNYSFLANFIAVGIDTDMPGLFPLIESIVNNQHPSAKIKVDLIRGLLLSERPKSWKLVEQLVLVAGRQEGLRQIVFESLDECHPNAISYFLNVIHEHKLERFSAVVRAMCVWCGLFIEPKETKAISNMLNWMRTFTTDITLAHATLKDTDEKNSLKLYLALWAIGAFEISNTLPILSEYIEEGTDQKRYIASLFLKEVMNDVLTYPLYAKALRLVNVTELSRMNDLEVGYIGNILDGCYRLDWLFFADASTNMELFDYLYDQIMDNKLKGKAVSGLLFSWDKAEFEPSLFYQILYNLVENDEVRIGKLISNYELMNSGARHYLVTSMLNEYEYKNHFKGQFELPVVSELKRTLAFKAAQDKTEHAMNTGLTALKTTQLDIIELKQLFELFKRKKSTLRSELLQFFSLQPNVLLTELIDTSLTIKNSQQLSALTELIKNNFDKVEIKDRLTHWIETLNQLHPESEEVQSLNLLNKDPETISNSKQNGIETLGLYDVDKINREVEILYEPTSDFPKYIELYPYGLTKPLKEVQTEIEKLYQIYQSHMNYEYEMQIYSGEKRLVLLGNEIAYSKYFDWQQKWVAKYEYFPLKEVWLDWFNESGLQLTDLCIIKTAGELADSLYSRLKNIEQFYILSQIKTFKNLNTYYNNPLNCIISALITHLMPLQSEKVFAYLKDFQCYQIVNFIQPSYTEIKAIYDVASNSNAVNISSANLELFNQFGGFLRHQIKPLNQFTKEEVKFSFNLKKWLGTISKEINMNPFSDSNDVVTLYLAAYQHKLINRDELFEILASASHISFLNRIVQNKTSVLFAELIADCPQIPEFFEEIVRAVLSVELKRGDAPTPVTHIAKNIQIIDGANYLFDILKGMHRIKLKRNNFIYTNQEDAVVDKQTLFSHYLEHCYPSENDTFEEFIQGIKSDKISEVRLIETAMYAPQWANWISRYLEWEGLESGIWWFHAHTKTDGYRPINSMLESEIARYSKLDVDEFKIGMVDIDWFVQAYANLGETRWKILYESAKYISEGIGHRRARIYTDVLSKQLTLDEVTEKIVAKRDQEFLRVYGLVELDKKSKERDILNRYEFLQSFLKESRQFGALKQASEAVAVEVAMANLAQNAGFSDPIRLTFAMESQQVQAILASQRQVIIDDVHMCLAFDENGIASINVFKGGKPQKSIPAKLKKSPEVLPLLDKLKVLLNQEKRAKITLENAMVNGERFSFNELTMLSMHPVLGAKLSKLALITDDNYVGFLSQNKLIEVDGAEINISNKNENNIRIAHCYDLHSLNIWQNLQHHCFKHQLVQPFKQIFRELYTIMDDEKNGTLEALRYAGHQVNPKQALALLKSRGWKLDYEEGLQKNIHKAKIGIKLYALADWFSPADMEAPTLESICFYDLKTHTQLTLESITPILFSEVMRDIDLVVSVAHVGGVDPEASQSSIELRAHILRETLQLFKLSNVEILKHHVKIKGTIAEYSIHLGSGTVHQVGASAMPILPVHSQHRGKIFLPFVDDDPRSAEIMSKVLLLANDDKIQDPTIIALIKR